MELPLFGAPVSVMCPGIHDVPDGISDGVVGSSLGNRSSAKLKRVLTSGRVNRCILIFVASDRHAGPGLCSPSSGCIYLKPFAS